MESLIGCLPSLAEESDLAEDLRNYELDDPELFIDSPSNSSNESSGSDEEAGGVSICRASPSITARDDALSTSSATAAWVANTAEVTAKYIPKVTLPPFTFPFTSVPPKMPNSGVPKPGPAKLSKKSQLPEWLSEAKLCHFLPEAIMKQLCEMVKECLMEGEYCIDATVREFTLTTFYRVQYSTCLHACYDLRGYSRSILRSTRAVPYCWWHARRDQRPSTDDSYQL